MKSFYLSIWLFSLCFSVTAQITNVNKRDDIIKQIKIIEDLEVKAILESDSTTLKKIWADDYHVYNPYNLILNKDQVLQAIKSTFLKVSLFKREQEYYGVYDNVIFVMGKETVVFSGKNPDRGKTLVIRYTDVYKLFDGHWKIIARHANIII
jgi:hypothetical protein